jgi:hypothetical protein
MPRSQYIEFPGNDEFGTCNPVGIPPTGTDDQIRATLLQIKSNGLDWVRTDFSWNYIQPSAKVWRWDAYDRLVRIADEVGIKLLPILCYSAKWASSGATTTYPPTSISDFVAYVSATVSRYPQIMQWEVWNEPNIYHYWLPQPNAAAYTELLKATYSAVKATNPAATVVLGGLSRYIVTNDPIRLRPDAFLSDIYANGGQGCFDALGFHPYDWHLPAVKAQLCAMRQLMTVNGDGDKKIWITEYGSQSTEVGVTSHATYLKEFTRYVRQVSWIGPTFFFCWKDWGTYTYGMLGLDGTPKPAYTAVQRAVQRVDYRIVV